MNKKLITISLLIVSYLLIISLSNNLHAEELSNSQYFKVEYDLGRQSVWNNSIPLNVYIIPKADYNRVEISFNHGTMTEVRYTGPQYFPVKAGQTYKVQGKIYPKEKGTHYITINAIAWEYDTNYTSSTSATVNVDEKLQIIPQSQAYKVLNILKYIFIILVIAGTIIGIYVIAKKNAIKIKKWLEPEY